MRAWHAFAATLLCAVLFGAWLLRVERRLDALDWGSASSTTPAGSVPSHAGERSGTGEGGATLADHDRRIAALETDVGAMLEAQAELSKEAESKASLADVSQGMSPERILAVVNQETTRVRDKHLAFHRNNLVQLRDKASAEFATQYGLNPEQNQRIRRLLFNEVDGMVAILSRPELLEQPARALEQWQALLRQTDEAAEEWLNPAQYAAFKAARAKERREYMPWLPQDPPVAP